MLFFIPFTGLALGAGLGALFGHMGENGIDSRRENDAKRSCRSRGARSCVEGGIRKR